MSKVKLKSKRGAAKRFKKTGSGYKRRQANRSHILTKKSTKRKRHLRKNVTVRSCDVRSVRRLVKDEG